jgi:hypothetical protein
LEGVEVPLPAFKGVDTPSIEGALETPPEAILIFEKERFGQRAIKIVCVEREF